jgi:transcriptional regulator with XRE-family HTH domain
MGKVPVSKVAELRKLAGLTQRQLADEVGVTESTISNWEQGRNSLVWLERVAKLCHALNCTPDQLIDYIDIDSVSGAKPDLE